MDATPPPPSGPDPYTPPQAPLARPGRSRALSALGAAVGVFLVTLSALIGFVGTCFPIGLFTLGGGPEGVAGTALQQYSPWVVGLVGGVVAGFVAARLIFRKR